MNTARLSRCVFLQVRATTRCQCSSQLLRAQGVRRFSTARPSLAAASPSASPAGPLPALGTLLDEFDEKTLRFDVNASEIQILKTPAQFYETLKAKILGAKSRVFLSALYIGRTEQDLISVIQTALRNNPELKISFLVDALRGTRESPNPSCASLLAPLITEFGASRVDIRMFHTPNLVGLRKKYIPRRINEGWGLQHMKLYGFDDEIILSGANLSQDYFTNRQDRYFLFKSKEITDYFSGLHDAVSQLSFQVQPKPSEAGSYTLAWPTSNKCVSPLEDAQGYVSAATKQVAPLLKPVSKPSSKALSRTDTAVYPLSQFTAILDNDTSTELPLLQRLLTALLTKDSSWVFTAGYFNVHKSLSRILTSTPSPGTVITASPRANGFYGSAGVSGLLPPAYILLSRRFLEAAQRANTLSHISLREWQNGTVGEPEGWTYHAKGIWITLPPLSPVAAQAEKSPGPSVTLVGSSNYTQRSYKLDLESNALIVTKNDDLRRRLKAETDHLLEYTKKIELEDFQRHDRRVGINVRIAMWIVKVLGGAL